MEALPPILPHAHTISRHSLCGAVVSWAFPLALGYFFHGQNGLRKVSSVLIDAIDLQDGVRRFPL